jgi:2-dehydropantoate 2-reductase
MRHAILGPGGVGGLIGAVLADAGEDLTLIVRPGTESSYPREISLESPFRSLRAPVSIDTGPRSAFDVLWITVKATQLQDACRSPPNFKLAQSFHCSTGLIISGFCGTALAPSA